ncbi:MAG: rod shape-determining protein MreC [Mangrovicoccus sp.]|nr:rod shape-determining protein MreC [Mangrovicoccus sp.]
MSYNRDPSQEIYRPLRRIFLGGVLLCLCILFILWRIDSPRVERMRAAVVDAVVPKVSWVLKPVTISFEMAGNFRTYQQLYRQNQDLRRELQQMKAWKEAALQLEQQNAQLLDLNNLQLDPKLTFVTGVVLADSGSPFRQSVLLNIGARDGIRDGWAAMDGIGVVGRISGVGRDSARVILLTDTNSTIPVRIQPSSQHALMIGDNSPLPYTDFIETPELVRPGDRVVTSGDGGLFPPDLLVGQIVEGRDGRLRVRLAADYGRMEFLRVLRSGAPEKVDGPGGLIAPPVPPSLPDETPDLNAEAPPEEPESGSDG